jgi:hypothetical protein
MATVTQTSTDDVTDKYIAFSFSDTCPIAKRTSQIKEQALRNLLIF